MLTGQGGADHPGEEQGLYGPAHFAAQLKAAGANVLGDLNMDIIGSSLGGNGVRDRQDIRLFNEGVPTSETPAQTLTRQNVGGENDGVSRQLARYIKETGENDTTDMTVALRFRRDRYLRGGDQISFLQQGYPAVRFTEPNENYDHQHRGAHHSASYNTDLKWSADPEPDVVGYEVVWRDSTEPLWTHSRFVGNVTSYTLVGINKDDWQVGVRAVDRDGNRSPVAFAVPGS